MQRSPLILLVGIVLALLIPVSASANTVVKLHGATVAHVEPRATSDRVMTVAKTTQITNAPTRLLVRERVYDNTGTPWYRVLLPGRGHGKGGWVRGDTVSVESVRYSVRIDLSDRRATLYDRTRKVRSYRVVIGASSTPTPTGSFQVLETVRQPNGAATGPYVLATNAYSNVLKQFGGGPGQIGLHGRTGLSDPLGSAASHGCVRFADSAIVALSAKLVAGSPVRIRR